LNKENTYSVHIKGLVQGVGFRPFVYRVASKFMLVGNVENRNDGVFIRVNCSKNVLDEFLSEIKQSAPPASYIESIDFKIIDNEKFYDFSIVKSSSVSNSVTDISPDIAVCTDCLVDMEIQNNRIDYPFINCTNCGPRFTIIENIPYDREKTTMRNFIMCDSCRAEYEDIEDRRFHAQPVACDICGPQYKLHFANKVVVGTQEIIKTVAELIDSGEIVAIKGLGGYFVACDANNELSVSRLRRLKNREGKPFAVMFKDIEVLKDYAYVNEIEEQSLLSFRRPIVLLKKRKEPAYSVCRGFDTIGVMLPYMPLHYLLFKRMKTDAIVLTSGNISDEPIIIDESKDFDKLLQISDAVLSYNRDIYNRTDDSVVSVVNNKERIFRRSRGYVPGPFVLRKNVDGIFSAGAELVNCFAIGKENKAILSQHIGDLQNMETYDFYCETIERFSRLFMFKPKIVVSDLHPHYLSTRYAEETNLPHIKVQHHHAHIASCMAEHGLDEDVIGVSFDGTGLGDDGKIWGGEFFICNLKEYTRLNHFDYVQMPGGDKAAKQPWRMAISYLYRIYGKDFQSLNLEFLRNKDTNTIKLLCDAIDNEINCPLTSSSGRLFDAVAAITNLCPDSQFHAEAPMRLESVAGNNITGHYPFQINQTISFDETIREIVNDIINSIHLSIISAKFHNTIIQSVFETAIKIRKDSAIKKIVLSGGTFQNKYLLERLETLLNNKGFDVYTHSKIPTNDAGIALGQMIVAASGVR
jgi:hydrogenase maturation protein HypF